MPTGITFGDMVRTVLWMICYFGIWVAVLWVTRQEISYQNLAMYFLIASCWLAWVNNTRTNRVLKALEKDK